MNLLNEKDRIEKLLHELTVRLESTQTEISVTKSKLKKLEKVIKQADEIMK